jgi:hypothetical protein
MRAETALLGALVLSWIGASSHVHAYCRTTTCDPRDPERAGEPCATDARGCVVEGIPLWRDPGCITLWLSEEPEPLPGIGAAELAELTLTAFETWQDAACGPGQPALQARLNGTLECALSSFDAHALEDLDSVRAVREDWPHPRTLREIALTTVSYHPSTGEIIGARIELNADDNRFSLAPESGAVDLPSALAHEAGHALGLAHSDVADATMFPRAPTGSSALRTLSSDDEAGICEVYPAAQGAAGACADMPAASPSSVCEAAIAPPRERTGGCTAAPRVEGTAGWIAACALALIGGALRRRRRA